MYGVAQKRIQSGLPYATGGPLLMDATRASIGESELDSENALLGYVQAYVYLHWHVYVHICEYVYV